MAAGSGACIPFFLYFTLFYHLLSSVHFLCSVFPHLPASRGCSNSESVSLSPFADPRPAHFQAQLKPLASISFLLYKLHDLYKRGYRKSSRHVHDEFSTDG